MLSNDAGPVGSNPAESRTARQSRGSCWREFSSDFIQRRTNFSRGRRPSHGRRFAVKKLSAHDNDINHFEIDFF